MSTKDVNCGRCWARPGEPCHNTRTGADMVTFHAERKERAKRKGVFGVRSVLTARRVSAP